MVQGAGRVQTGLAGHGGASGACGGLASARCFSTNVPRYKCRWQVELFLKWIKQYLRINAFYGTSANAVKTQIWSAISVNVLVAILKKELKLDRSLGEITQILSITLFEKDALYQILTATDVQSEPHEPCNQLRLFDL